MTYRFTISLRSRLLIAGSMFAVVASGCGGGGGGAPSSVSSPTVSSGTISGPVVPGGAPNPGLPPTTSNARYSIVDIGTLGGATSAAEAINDTGQVAGSSDTNSGRHAFVFSGGKMTDLGVAPGATSSQAHAINSAGLVAGDSSGDPTVPGSAFIGPPLTLIPTSSTFIGSAGNDINDSGQIAGSVTLTNGTFHAAIGSSAGWQDIGVLPGASFAEALAVNSSGQLAGYSGGWNGGSNEHAFLYDGSMHDLGVFPGGQNSIAQDINSAGIVVGSADIASGSEHAFTCSGGTLTDIGTLGGPTSTAYCINDSNAIVGTADLASADPAGNISHAFLYSGKSMVDANSLIPPNTGWELTSAFGINRNGVIVGEGTINGSMHAFIMTPN